MLVGMLEHVLDCICIWIAMRRSRRVGTQHNPV